MGGGDSWQDALRTSILEGIPSEVPAPKSLDDTVDHAPARPIDLSPSERRLALENALRYLPETHHDEVAGEFLEELEHYGRIIMHRYRPTAVPMKAYPIDAYPAKSRQAASIMLMIMNNLDPAVAQFPHELITYGGNGSVFQNWAQYRLTMRYLATMTDEQCLPMYSGHPLGLFPSHPASPRVVVTNGMVIPNHSSQHDFARMNALGVTQYGQMTAGSYMYIGPQGIVHGTTITLLNAARLHLGLDPEQDLGGVTFVTSGLGGMSGAQAKAAVITGAACLICEVNPHAAYKRHEQGWLSEVHDDLDLAIDRLVEARDARLGVSIGYVGNIVDVWERLIEREVNIDLGSDQTSLHNPFGGGYCPVGRPYKEAMALMAEDPDAFRSEIQLTLVRHAAAIDTMAERGMYFWDYGNAFLLEASRAGANLSDGKGGFRYPSYVEDIMGPMCFDFGFGPYRWVCTSGLDEDLLVTDAIASQVIRNMLGDAPDEIRQQLLDNLRWIESANDHQMAVGTRARILYADAVGRAAIATEMNRAVADGRLKGPIVLGRDHHDVSGTDSPYRETANIRDGSSFTADMAVQNVIGDAFRGATWVSIHNGGGVGWGEVINGGFGLLLDGSEAAGARAQAMLTWDVENGVARRAWARNPGAISAIERAMRRQPDLEVTLPGTVDQDRLDQWLVGEE
ncbi:MAG: urocanate hydratase [Euryarchaeota archaeon]|nr:urocanate hydratase [Euryarchaeota archaeon]|tara:strand:- start:804 stop:2846 length:2043 start_codon:yes stop_codon:yes gene_type:complete